MHDSMGSIGDLMWDCLNIQKSATNIMFVCVLIAKL